MTHGMTGKNGPVQLYYGGCRAELDNDLKKAEELCCLAASQDPSKPIYLQIAAQVAARKGRVQDARWRYREAFDCTAYAAGYGNAVVTSLTCGALGG